ncbi:uncharacterized protein [Physcomitrium patens]|uniref:DUF3593 domain-containing protein n=1 Tax=Physcomitrium patens TaxID=3218 RepID=A0A2K1K8K4_PHYPA|nr:uncharacterized protein LOC112285517 isoform X1 [Physcomitrium patens]PNR50099.1 hypothetical protein PHYPA_011996 [Physcomitrium patens]|eukprot:XP_024382193.1 uncharacterized protein LOC112285517 isoform X1 [Physcomitrella patens]
MALCCVLVAASPPLLRASWSSLRPTALRPALPSAAWCRSAGRCPGSRVGKGHKGIRHGVVVSFLPVDPWAPNTDQQSIASSLFAASLFPYLGFLYHITKSKTAPKLTLFGFYFLLAFVGATIPAGIYAKVHYGTSLSNVDWLHGGAESLLTLTNLFIVFGLRNALQNPSKLEEDSNAVSQEEDGVPLSK